MTANQRSFDIAPELFQARNSGPGGVARRARRSGFPLVFRALYLAGLAVTLPVVAATRLLPRRRCAHLHESIFAETNCAVLTALEIGFMA